MTFRDRLPVKTPGPTAPPVTQHNLSVDHLNRLSDAADRFNKFARGGNSNSIFNDLGSGQGVRYPWVQSIVEVIDFIRDDQGVPRPGLYQIKIRFWEPEGVNSTAPTLPDHGIWKTEEPPYDPLLVVETLDARGLDLTYELGDRVVAFLDDQREAWIPCDASNPNNQSCNPLVEFDSVNFGSPDTIPEVDPLLKGHVVAVQLEISYDGGTTWLVAQGRRFRGYPDTTGSNFSESRSAGVVTVNGFVSVVANDETLFRVTASIGDKLRGTAVLRAASMRIFALCQNGSGHHHVNASITKRIPASDWALTMETGNAVENLDQGKPYITVFNRNMAVIRTPLIDPKNDKSGREWWSVGVDFTAAIQITAIGCNSLIDTQSSTTDAQIPSDGVGIDGDHVKFWLEQNGEIIHNRVFYVGLADQGRASGVGFTTFSAGNADVIRLCMVRGDNASAELEGACIRLEAKCLTASPVSGGNVGAPSNTRCAAGLATVAEINNTARSWWPTFENRGDNIQVACPQNTDRYMIEAEFHVTVQGDDGGLSSMSSSSSIEDSSVSTSSNSSSSRLDTSQSSGSSASSKSSRGTSEEGGGPPIEGSSFSSGFGGPA